MNIQSLIESYDSLVKEAFIPNPQAQQDQGQLQQAQQQLMGMISQLPPQLQQQIAPSLQQLQQLPPDQQMQAMQQLAQQIQQVGQQQAQPQQPQEGQPAEQAEQEPQQAAGNVNAENSLDNTKVTLSVRELLDLSSGGKATHSLLKVKQLADTHNKKMEAMQKQQQQAEDQAQQEQAQQSAMGQGGIYTAPMGSGKPQQ
jgi:hypothetical protein